MGTGVTSRPPSLQTAPGLSLLTWGMVGMEKRGRLLSSPETMGGPVERAEGAKVESIMIFKASKKCSLDQRWLFCIVPEGRII